MGLGAILEGHTKELLGLNKSMSEQRMEICRKCPLFKNGALGAMCNSKLWYNEKTGDVSTTKKDGYVNGCGCRLSAKTTLPYASCPRNQW